MPIAGTPARGELLARNGCLNIVRQPNVPVKPAPGQPGSGSSYVQDTPEIFVSILDDDRIFAFNGHVDLGTGIRTSLGQIVAEELDVSAARVRMILGDSAEVPNQGPTIASATIQISAVPLRFAAAQARLALIELAARVWDLDAALLRTDDGCVIAPDDTRLTFGALLRGQCLTLALDTTIAVKDPSTYRVVGRSSPRVDMPAKATGAPTFVHDMRVPGMLHGRVVRPPYAGHDCGEFIGKMLVDVDRASVQTLPGVRGVVVIGDFVGVVAEREEQAIRAARALQVKWRPMPSLPSLDDPAKAISQAATLID